MVDPVLSRERVEQLRDIGVLTSMFFDAAETERRLPAVVRKQTRAAWPDYPDEPDAYGWTDEEVRLGPASAKAIEDYNLALNLTFLMGEQDRKLVWNVAHSAAFRTRGAQWRSLSQKMGVAAPTVRRRFEYAILRLWQLIGHMATTGVPNSAKSDNLLIRCGS